MRGKKISTVRDNKPGVLLERIAVSLDGEELCKECVQHIMKNGFGQDT